MTDRPTAATKTTIHTTVSVMNSHCCNILQIPVNAIPRSSLTSAVVFHRSFCPGDWHYRVTLGTMSKYTFTHVQEHPDSLSVSLPTVTLCQV